MTEKQELIERIMKHVDEGVKAILRSWDTSPPLRCQYTRFDAIVETGPLRESLSRMTQRALVGLDAILALIIEERDHAATRVGHSIPGIDAGIPVLEHAPERRTSSRRPRDGSHALLLRDMRMLAGMRPANTRARVEKGVVTLEVGDGEMLKYTYPDEIPDSVR